MKRILILLMIIPSVEVFSQTGQCNCTERQVSPENQYTCDTTYFKNGSKLYWQWNCDSAWLTFENQGKVILKTCETIDVYSCQRTGLNFLKEYPEYLLFQYQWISGCCTPPDLIFLSKDNGKEIRRIKKTQYIHGDIEGDYALYFSDTTFTELILLDHLTNKSFSMVFGSEQVMNSATGNKVLELTQLFRNYEIEKNSFTFDFKSGEGVWNNLKIEIK